MNRRVEYRVELQGYQGNFVGWEHVSSLEEVRAIREREGTPMLAVEVREVISTPWEDLPEEEANGYRQVTRLDCGARYRWLPALQGLHYRR